MATFKIVSQFNGLALDVRAFGRAPGVPIQQWADNGAANQQWELVPVGQNHFARFKIISRSSGLLLALPDNNPADGRLIQQSADNDFPYQHWNLVLANADGITFMIGNAGTDKVLDIPAWSTNQGDVIQQYELTGETNQQWKLIRVS